MDDMTAFERQVGEEICRVVGPARPVDDLAVFEAAASTSASGWFPALFSATKLVVAGATVALVGGLLLSGVLTQRPQDATPAVGASTSPTASARPIELPTRIPKGVDSGTLDTPLGKAHWVHLAGDETTMPPSLWGLASVPDGYVVPEWDTRPSKLWRSSDLISWTSEPLGIEARSGVVTYGEGMYWLSTGDPAGLWRSPDMASWERLDLEDLAPPDPAGFAWRLLYLDAPVVQDGVVLVPLEYGPDPWVLIPDPWIKALPDSRLGGWWPDLTEIGPGVYEVGAHPGQGAHRFLGTLRFEETRNGLRVVDQDDGTELAVLDGISMAFVERLASGEELPWPFGFAIVEGDALADVDLPGDAHLRWHLALTADDSGVTFYSLGTDGLVHVHRSPNGRDWTEVDVFGDDPDEPSDIESVYSWSPGSVTIGTGDGEWTAADGALLRQERATFGFDVRGNPWTRRPKDGQQIHFDITHTGAFKKSECSGGIGAISGNTEFRSQGPECRGLREIWIVTFDEVPA